MRRKRSVLQVRLEEEIVETRAETALLARSPKVDLQGATQAIRKASRDRRIGALVVRFAHPDIGWAKAASLARSIEAFRSSGKPVVAFLEGAGNLDYGLACACETLIMHPGASLDLVGLQAEAFFFKDLLEQIGIEAQLDSVGEYKSAGETFMRSEMSPPSREALRSLLVDLSDQLEHAIAKGRGLATERVREVFDDGPYTAEEALRLGLVDRVDQEDACESLLREKLDVDVVVVPHSRYRVRDAWLKRLLTFRRQQVAVVYAVGVIASGDHRRARPSTRVVGSRSFQELLKRVRESPRVKAVVLRVESPGGSAVASDLIWREVALTRKKKPVIVSMGDVAASGGYYIATAADAIVAEASTLTGSIGIVGGKMVARRLLDKLGIQRETIALSKRAGFRSPTRSFTVEERDKQRAQLRYFYEKLFVPRVAEGRRLELKQVDDVARGRVWTGRQGKERGLIDELGDLETAIQLARDRAGVAPEKKIRVVMYAKRPRLRELLSLGLPWGSVSFSGTPLAPLFDLLGPLASEEALFLMPWILRIK